MRNNSLLGAALTAMLFTGHRRQPRSYKPLLASDGGARAAAATAKRERRRIKCASDFAAMQAGQANWRAMESRRANGGV